MVGARSRAAGLTLGVLGWLMVGWGAGAQTPEEIFDRGNDAYTKGNFEQAARAYGLVLDYRIRDPRVEYNMGNAQFKIGRLGQAILHYERARRLDPTDEDILANLEYARSFRVDRVEPDERSGLVRRIERLQDRLGPDTQAWLLLALFWLLIALGAWILARPRRWRAAFGWSVTVLLLLVALGGVSWYTTHERLEGQQLAVIVEEVVDVLAGPGLNNPTLFTVHEGLTVEVRDVRADWIQVSLPNGLNGWLDATAVEIV